MVSALQHREYSQKTGMPIFPGSLNVALDAAFDWFAPEIERRTIWFGREEYGGARDILLVPCVLDNLNAERAMLWTQATAARERPDPWVVEVIAGVNLRATYGLSDGDVVEILIASDGSRHIDPEA
jgi:CTP-dependent riboflavin kinase